MQRLGTPLQRRASALAGRPVFWIALVSAIAAWPLVWSLRTSLPDPLPVLTALPRLDLTDQRGAAFGSKDLDGRVWVASLVFTRGEEDVDRLVRDVGWLVNRGS
jgi:cytochrome oxidase Cu insertion factor (SCO1/SenC/PrrC family)